MSVQEFIAASIELEKLCEQAGIEPLLYTAESLREAMLNREPTPEMRRFINMGENEFEAVAHLVLKQRKEKAEASSLWDELWPVTDRFEEFCLSQHIPMPSHQRVPRKWVIEEFNAIDPATLNTEQADTWHHFQAMSKADFDLMFSELYNPFRLSDRQKH